VLRLLENPNLLEHEAFTEWLSHMEHLKSDYPYLFSLAVRSNPFDPNASIAVA